ncbi:acyl-CoA carboxylase subunit beta [Tsukamurella sp. PLM1]|uniref:acyl-CoA carboxylase subunit beta n=1 Tax=Tsukamurella sp. PLM1 TaxID=2929795 RepID=UPI00206B6F63|nr:carboxyl transferase domain-containing protein [Tsukamurella sp. PLM1]BDH59651.1 acetyl-CoA carboxylase carboxyltransferase subunit [Tsukamurella sp. PLM1]
MTVYTSNAIAQGEAFDTDRAGMLSRIEELRALERRAVDTSNRAAARFASRGQLLPRDRQALLLDPGAPFLELQSLAGFAMTDNGSDLDREQSIPGGNQIVGIGFVAGTRCVVVITDSGINAGAYNTAGIGKLLRAQRIALENRLPFVHLVESAGANIASYRVDGFVNGGEMFANLARLSAAGVPVITVLHGSSTAGGAYMPGLSDVVVAVKDRAKAFLAGPPLLKAATGEIATDEELGGATMHADVSGLVEHLAQDDADAIRIVRDVIARLHWSDAISTAPRDYTEPRYPVDELAGIVPIDYRTPYDVREVIARIVDGSEFVEFGARYGSASVCVEAAVHGHPVAMIGNNGPIDNAGATKISHFIQHCCHIGTPIIFLQNTTGYMVGTEHERGGMIKNGSKMIQAVATATVPRITLMIGASFGAGNFGMCGRGYAPRFVLSWPNARIGLMGPEQAGVTMRTVAEASARRRGVEPDEAEMTERHRSIADLIERQSDAFYTSGRLLDDGVIDPRDTRRALAFLLQTIREAEEIELRPITFGVARH